MPVTIDGTNGIVSPGVDSTNLVLDGSTSGSITMLAPAVAGTNTQTLVAVTGTLAPVVRATAITVSGTTVDFTSIPSWVKKITVMLSGVSTSGTSNIIVQLGDSGGVETTSYSGAVVNQAGSQAINFSTGFALTPTVAAADVQSGNCYITNLSDNIWTETSALATHAAAGMRHGAGTKTLSDTLTQVRITTVNGTDTFDAGTINIIYE
jgi:hypothetical protein